MGDALGDRMKAYEARETERRFMPMLPVTPGSMAGTSLRSLGIWRIRMTSV